MALFPQSNGLSFLVGALVIAALACGGVALYQSGYSAGEEGERKTWQAKWDKQSAELAEARVQNVQLAREEEQRRQRAVDKVRQDAVRLMPLLPVLLLLGCSSKPAAWQPEPVSAPTIPALPSQAMQPDSPPWCSPTCSAGLMRERESWLEHMTELEYQAWPAKKPTYP